MTKCEIVLYLHIVRKLFLENTNHCGGTSTRVRLRELKGYSRC